MDVSPPPLPVVVAQFVREALRYSPATLDRYRRILGGLAGRAPTLLALDAACVRAYAGERHAAGIAPRTLRQELGAVRALCRWAITAGLRDDDPTLAVDWPAVPKSHPRGLSTLQLRQLIHALEHPPRRKGYSRWQHERNRLAVLLMLYAGLRLMEAARLRWEDVDLEAGVLYVVMGKGRKDRAVPLHPDLSAALADWRRVSGGRGTVITTRRGGPLDEDTMPHIYARWLPSLGVRGCNAHRLRRTCANELRRQGADIRDIQEILGHASSATTDIYLDPDPELVRPAIERLPGLAAWGVQAGRRAVVQGARARA